MDIASVIAGLALVSVLLVAVGGRFNIVLARLHLGDDNGGLLAEGVHLAFSRLPLGVKLDSKFYCS